MELVKTSKWGFTEFPSRFIPVGTPLAAPEVEPIENPTGASHHVASKNSVGLPRDHRGSRYAERSFSRVVLAAEEETRPPSQA